MTMFNSIIDSTMWDVLGTSASETSATTAAISNGSGWPTNIYNAGNCIIQSTVGQASTLGIFNNGRASSSVVLNESGIKMAEHCDIHIGNRSLNDTLSQIESRLAILHCNPKLEEEWDELKALGDAYRALEQQIHASMKTWDILKSTDV